METLFIDTDNRNTFIPEQLYSRPDAETVARCGLGNSNFAAFQRLQKSLFTFNSTEGAPIAASLLYQDTDRPNQILVNFEPFSDGAPQSDPSEMLATKLVRGGHRQLSATEELFQNEFRRKPHSLGPLVRAAVIHDELTRAGQGMPVLTIFNPIPGKAFSKDDREKIWHGDMSPFGLLAHHALIASTEKIHGKHGVFDELFFAGQSIGAVRAIHAAKMLSDRSEAVSAVVAQEAVIYDEPNTIKGVFRLANDYMIHKYNTSNSDVYLKEEDTYILIPENELRILQTGLGTESVGMLSRMIRGMVPRDMIGLTKSGIRTTESMAKLAERGVQVTSVNAVDSAVSRYMRDWLATQPSSASNLHQILISPLRGGKLGHMINEYASATGLAISRGVSFAQSR